MDLTIGEILKARSGQGAAQERVISALSGLVRRSAGYYVRWGRKRGLAVSLDSLISEGNAGLLEAIKDCACESLPEFQECATKAVRNSIDRYLRFLSKGQTQSQSLDAPSGPDEEGARLADHVADGKAGMTSADLSLELEDAERHLLPDEKEVWDLANGRGKERVPLTTEEIAVRTKSLPEDVHDLLASAGAKLRRCLHGGLPQNASILAGRKVAVIEDQPKELEALKRLLGRDLRMEVVAAEAEDEAVALLRSLKHSSEITALILDMHLPQTKKDGRPSGGGQIVGERLLLEAGEDMPVIVYSSLLKLASSGTACGHQQIERLRKKWSRQGALRCLEKPNLDDLVEALISIVALADRAALGKKPAADPEESLKLGKADAILKLEPSERRMSWKGRAIPLEPAAFNLAVVLARHALRDAVAPHGLLIETLLDPKSEGGASSGKEILKVQVSKLRKKLAATGFAIKPVRGLGYRLRRGP